MGTQAHHSENELAKLACRKIAGRLRPRILIGGLGLGYTLAAALRHLGTDAEVVVAELIPAVVAWNRSVLGELWLAERDPSPSEPSGKKEDIRGR